MQEAFIFKIPSGQVGDDTAGWKAKGWNLEKPDWTGKLKLISKGHSCTINLEERGSTKMYAQVEIDTYPGPAVQSVTDSSRFFVIRTSSGQHLGLGFSDRSDSFDLNVALQDHFKSLRVEAELEKEKDEPREQLDLAFKEGETIKVSINIPRKSNRERSKSPGQHAVRQTAGSSAGIMAPPSEAARAAGIIPPPAQGADNLMPRLNAPGQANPNWIQF